MHGHVRTLSVTEQKSEYNLLARSTIRFLLQRKESGSWIFLKLFQDTIIK